MKSFAGFALCLLTLLSAFHTHAQDEVDDFKPYAPVRAEDLHDAPQMEIYKHILNNVTAERVRSLGPLYDRAREEKLRDEDGDYVYKYLNHAMDRYLMTQGQMTIDRYRAGIIEWAEDEPESITAQALRIHLLLDYAWFLRGGGYISETNEQQIEGFEDTIRQILELVEEHGETVSEDPLFIDDYARLQMITGRPLSEQQETVVRYLEIFPDDFEAIETVAFASLPRWSGRADQLLEFAEFAHEQTEEDYGLAAYFVVAQTAYYNDGIDMTFDEFGFDLDKFLQGADDYQEHYNKYPNNKWSWNCAALVLTHFEERQRAAEYFKKIDGDYNSAVFRPANFSAWEKWATEVGPEPRRKRIHNAAKLGDLEYFERAVEREADLNESTEDGETPIHIAATNEHWELVRFLAENGAKADISYWWATPLSLSIEAGETETALTLIDNGVNPNYSWGNQNIPLWLAVDQGQLDVVEALLMHPDIQLELRGSGRRSTPLQKAVEKNDIQSARMLLEAGAYAKTQDGSGYTAIGIAAGQGNLPLVELLLEHGAYVDHRDSIGQTPLIYAAMSGFGDIVDVLIQHGADYNSKTDYDLTALILAAEHGQVSIVRALCDVEGIDLNVRDLPRGHTALHGAVEASSTGSLRALMKAGADPSIKDNEGRTPADLARASGNDRLVKYLEE